MKNQNLGRKVIMACIATALVVGISVCVAMIIHNRNGVQEAIMVEDGLSAYELAVQYGYEGTVEEWLDSLEGKSAYEIAVENGYSGTEDNWTSSLKASNGKDGVGIKTAAFSNGNELLITLTDGTILNLGVADGFNGKDGANGKDGTDGKDGVGITAANINADGQLVISFSNGKSVNLDKVVGMNGEDGIGVSSSEINASGELVITYTNGQTANLGVVVGAKGEKGDTGATGAQGVQGIQGVQGEKGAQGIQGEKGDKGDKGEQGETGIAGKDGVSVTKTEINNKGELVITLSDNTVSNLGVVVGAKGDKGDKGDAGAQGQQGISVVGAEINSKGELVLVFSNNQRTNVGNVIGAKGEKGEKGETGAQGIQGIQGVKGDKGEIGVAGKDGTDGIDGVSVSKTEINSKGELVITLSDNTVSNLGVVIGAKGEKGDKGETGVAGQDGEDGVGIETIAIKNGNLKITLTNETTLDLGNIKGEKGDKGETGASGCGIKATTINGVGELVIVYSDDTEVNLGKVVGATGEQGEKGDKGEKGEKGDKGDTGAQGVQGIQGVQGEKGDKGETGATGLGVKSTTINEAGELVIVYSDDAEVNLGKVVGADGAQGDKGDKGEKGDKGDTGAQGIQGIQGVQGEKGEQGAKGEKGDTGVQGVGVAKVEIVNDELVITLSDETVLNLGNIKGAKGEKGEQGVQGIGISAVVIDTDGHLKITLTTGVTTDLGNIKGADGRGVDEIKIENNILKIKYSDSDTFIELGNVKGEKGDKGDTGAQGPKGDPGRGILKTEIIDGHLWLTYTDDPENAIDLGAIYEVQPADDFLYYELANGTYGVKLNPAKIDIKVAEIPSVYKGKSVTQINEGAFSDCTTIERLIIPDSIKVIESDAFNNCDNLQTIYYYGSLQQWNEIEFSNEFSNPCSNGAYLYIGRDYKLLTEMIVPENVTAIKQYAFYGCSSLTSVTLPNSVETIGDYSFSNCENLSNVQLSDSVTTINQYAFNKCTSLQKITIPGAVTFIGRYAFYQAGLTKVVFEKTTNWTLSDGASFSFSYTYYASGYGTRTKTYTHNLADSTEAAKALVDSVSVSYQYNDPAGGWPTSNFSGTKIFHWYKRDWSRSDN